MGVVMRSRVNRAETGGAFTGLRFAVYARKSTEHDRYENHRSTTQQVE